MPELGPKTVAVLRAELGEVDRFSCTDQAVAYAGMDIEIKESGKLKGKAKLSKRGSGLLRQILYLAAIRSIHLEGSAFGAYYHHLVERGLKKMSAVMAVMRKMVRVTTHLMKTGEDYDPGKVWVGAVSEWAPTRSPPPPTLGITLWPAVPHRAASRGASYTSKLSGIFVCLSGS